MREFVKRRILHPMIERFSFGQAKKLQDGSTVTVRIKNPLQRFRASETALHEIEHAFVGAKRGVGIEEVSVVPGPGYLGFTRFSRPDAVAAAAPHANGRDGTEHDMNIVEHLGADESSACSAARTILAGREKLIEQLAGFLEFKQSIDGGEFLSALFHFEQGADVEIVRTAEDGTESRTTKHGVKENKDLVLSVADIPKIQV